MSDDELLEHLSAALAPEPTEPSPASIAALHRAIAARDVRPARMRRARRWAVPTLAGITVLGTSGAAFAATGATLPRPLRQAAQVLQLPVDSPALADARATRKALRNALAEEDRRRARDAAELLRAQLNALSPDERDQLGPTDLLFAQADRLLAPPGPAEAGDGAHDDRGEQPPVTAAPDVDEPSHEGDGGPGTSTPPADDQSGQQGDGPGPQTTTGNQGGTDEPAQGQDEQGPSINEE
jgi:hypothetical protein